MNAITSRGDQTPEIMSDAHQEPPLISICIPTYNRAHFLPNLFRSLDEVRLICGEQVEFCISNNCSSDGTAELISEWTAKLKLRVITQSENIGSTRNTIEVSKLARGRWIQVVGDDDTLYSENYARIVDVLRIAEAETWVLSEVSVGKARGANLRGLKTGVSASYSFRWTLLRTGLSRYGFIGQHLIPAVHLSALHSVSPKAFVLWPHIGLFLRHIGQQGRVLVWRFSLVRQAGGGSGLFWRADDWAKLQLFCWVIIHHAKQGAGLVTLFYNSILIREMYGLVGLKVLLSWKLHEPASYNDRAIGVYWKACRGLGWMAVLAAPFFALVLFLRIVSLKVLNYSPFRTYIFEVRKRYTTEKDNLSKFDGMKREGDKVGAIS